MRKINATVSAEIILPVGLRRKRRSWMEMRVVRGGE